MGYFVAITGKGGTGKTTIAGLMVLRLIARGCRPVLAVDADPNTCLDATLGVQVQKTIGSVREEAREIFPEVYVARDFDRFQIKRGEVIKID